MFALPKMVHLDVPVQVPIEVLSFGSVMLMIIVLIHGAGLDRIIARHKRKSEILRRTSWHPHLGTYIFAGAILFMLFLHVSRFACGVLRSGALASSETFATPCISVSTLMPPSAMVKWFCHTTGENSAP